VIELFLKGLNARAPVLRLPGYYPLFWGSWRRINLHGELAVAEEALFRESDLLLTVTTLIFIHGYIPT